MQRQPLAARHQDRVAAGLPFVESLARRVASSMPHSIELSDLVQDGMIGLIDAACRFDEGRGIKFETFAERRVRGAMIDALRRDAWPRGVRRQRRELEAAREAAAPGAGRRAVARRPRGARRIRRGPAGPHDRPDQHDRIDLAAVGRRPHRQLDAAAGAGPVRADRTGQGLRTAGSPRPHSRRDRVAAAARAQGDRSLLLRRSDDEADRRADRRQRVARVAAARAGGASPEEGARRRHRGGRQPDGRISEEHPPDADGQGRDGRHGRSCCSTRHRKPPRPRRAAGAPSACRALSPRPAEDRRSADRQQL